MNKFTPGPWFFEANTGRVVSAAGETLAFASAAHEGSLQNGPVLAAAPELLEALVAMNERLRLCFGQPISAEEAFDSFYQDIVSEAIAKATGATA